MIVPILIWIVCGLFAYRWWKQNWRSKNEPPKIPGGWPLIGHALWFVGDNSQLWRTVQYLTNQCSELGGTAFFSIGPKSLYVVTDPDDAMTVANTCIEKDEHYDFGKAWLGDGLVTASQTVWKNHRKLLNPAFGQHVLDGYVEVFNKQARKLVSDLAAEVDKAPFDHGSYITHYAMDAICSTVLGTDFSDDKLLISQYSQSSVTMFRTMVERFQNLFMHYDWIYNWTGLKEKENEHMKIMHNITDTVVQRKKSLMKDNVKAEKLTENKLAKRFKPFLELLLELRLEGNAFSDQQIRDHVNAITVGGHDTTALTLTYIFLMIGSFPHVQDKVYEELEEVFGKSDRDADKYDLNKLVYLEAVMKESMRIVPMAPIVARYVEKDVKLSNFSYSNLISGCIRTYYI